jgi:hypothetical protein
MLGRALIWATVVLSVIVAAPAGAQNLEAGKSPSQIFSGTCALCHKGPRGLLKSVPPGSLPGFLRQHYTTSSDMAAAMSAYVLSNGAANPMASGNLTRQGQEARSGGPAAEPGPERAAKGRKPTREAAKPETDGPPQAASAAQTPAGGEGTHPAGAKSARQKAAKAKASKGEPPPKIEARHEPAKEEPAKEEPPREEPGKAEAAKPEPAKTEEPAASETAKVEGTRADPVPAVTPAPKESGEPAAADKPSDTAAAKPAAEPGEVKQVEVSSGPLTIEIGPAPAPKAPAPAMASAPPVPPAGPPVPPISH